MGSGNPRIVINTQERAVSSDINRAESFLAKDSHEFDRHLINREISGDFFNFPGMQAPYTALPASSQFLIPHDCISGLMVRPDNASGLTIDPGEAAFFVPAFPNAGADDSKYVYVSDAGVSSLLTLTFTVNPGPGVRWDIVECQPTEALLESASRDIYNTTTGQFTSSVVPKVRAGTLTYRIRNGTPGGGIPDIDSEWMPLAAIHVRTDATGFLDSDVYDIRPLVNERCPWSPAHPKALPSSGAVSPGYRLTLYEAELMQNSDAGINGRALSGYFRGHFGGYWSGGKILRNMPSSSLATFGSTSAGNGSAPYFNPQATENQSASFSIAADARFTIGAFFPRGYPRWVRYSQNSISAANSNHLRKSGRLPNGPRGLLWIAEDAASANGVILPNTPPSVLGETEAAWGHVVGEGVTNGATAFYPPIGGGGDRRFMLTNNEISLGTGTTLSSRTRICSAMNLPASSNNTNVGGTASSMNFTLGRDYPIPPYARGVYLSVNLLLTFPATCFVIPQQAFFYIGSVGNARPGYPVDWNAPTALTDSSNVWVWNGVVYVPYMTNTDFDDVSPASSAMTLSFLLGHDDAAPSSLTGLAFVEGYSL
jgi:hypothetical protein